MENILINIGHAIAALATGAVILPGTGTLALFLYAWWTKRRALESR
jgi:hypothetical protein